MRSSLALRSATIVVAVFLLRTSVPAQWINHPNAGTPRTPDGKPNLAAPTPLVGQGYTATLVATTLLIYPSTRAKPAAAIAKLEKENPEHG